MPLVNNISFARNRLFLGSLANGFGLFVTLGIQLLSLPIFLNYWSLEQYGLWLMISAVPAYLALSDIGVTLASGNKMTMAISGNRITRAQVIFSSSYVVLVVVTTVIFFTASVILHFFGEHLIDKNAALALNILVAGVLLSLFNGLSEAVMRAHGRYAFGTFLGNFVKLLEWVGGVLALILVSSFISVAIGMLIGRVIGLLLTFHATVTKCRHIKWSCQYFSITETKKLFAPSVAHMAFPLGNAIGLQGITILVGSIYGASLVPIFNAYRTISRLTVQVCSVVVSPIGAEISRLYGEGKYYAVYNLVRKYYYINLFLSIFLCVFVFFIFEYVIDYWGRSKIEYISTLAMCVMIYSFVGSLSAPWRILLQSLNKHSKMAVSFFTISILVLFISYFFGKQFDIHSVVIAMGAGEFVFLCSVYWLSKYVLTNYKNAKR